MSQTVKMDLIWDPALEPCCDVTVCDITVHALSPDKTAEALIKALRDNNVRLRSEYVCGDIERGTRR